MRVPGWPSCLCALVVMVPAVGRPFHAGSKGCGITGMQYVVRGEEDLLSGALVSTTCGGSGCGDVEEYATGVLWEQKYYLLRAGLPDGLHLVDSCENAQHQAVRVGPNAADATWYGVAVAR
ncbi:unnamed protein product [Ectocarpus sp. 13 AM-2016]